MNTVCPAQIHGQLAGYCSVNTSNIEGSIFICILHMQIRYVPMNVPPTGRLLQKYEKYMRKYSLGSLNK